MSFNRLKHSTSKIKIWDYALKHTQSMTKSPEGYPCSSQPSDATNHLSAPTTENWFWKLKSNGVRNCKSVTRFYC